jgi:hypothetical protein
MPDHIHLLMTTGNISEAVRHIKGGFSCRLGSKLPAWQHGFTDHLVLNPDQFRSRRDYIHPSKPNPRRNGHQLRTVSIFLGTSRPRRKQNPQSKHSTILQSGKAQNNRILSQSL